MNRNQACAGCRQPTEPPTLGNPFSRRDLQYYGKQGEDSELFLLLSPSMASMMVLLGIAGTPGLKPAAAEGCRAHRELECWMSLTALLNNAAANVRAPSHLALHLSLSTRRTPGQQTACALL